MKALQAIIVAGFAIATLALPRFAAAGPPPGQVESLTPPEEGSEASPEASPAATPEPPAIAPGTVITKTNWMQYLAEFPVNFVFKSSVA